MRHLRLRALLAATALLTVGCGSRAIATSDQSPPRDETMARHTMPDGTSLSDADMEGMGATRPSEAASMVCSGEIRRAVKRTFQLDRQPHSTHDWSRGRFTCRYQLPDGPLELSVEDFTDKRLGHAYFTGLRSRLTRDRTITGVPSLGFPAFETPDGTVGFLKDGKTLLVDARRVSTASLPTGFSRAEAAYGVAAAVIGCWTE